MVFEYVGVFVEVDCFECEFAEAFAAVGVGGACRGDAAAAEFGAGAVLRGQSAVGLMVERRGKRTW